MLSKSEIKDLAEQIDNPTFVLLDPELQKLGDAPIAGTVVETWTNMEIAMERAKDKNYQLAIARGDPVGRLEGEIKCDTCEWSLKGLPVKRIPEHCPRCGSSLDHSGLVGGENERIK